MPLLLYSLTFSIRYSFLLKISNEDDVVDYMSDGHAPATQDISSRTYIEVTDVSFAFQNFK